MSFFILFFYLNATKTTAKSDPNIRVSDEHGSGFLEAPGWLYCNENAGVPDFTPASLKISTKLVPLLKLQ